jgi:hypothetical protein
VFKEAEGPTALREDLVYSLSLSLGVCELETPEGFERCCGGLVGVWNGRKGFVSLLIRLADQPSIRRLVYAEPLTSAEELDEAIEAGMSFAETLGFTMDAPEFRGLEPDAQRQRLDAWTDLRKLSREPVAFRDLPSRSDEADWDEEDTAPQQVPHATAEDDAATAEAPAILGKVSLVRKREGDEGFADPLVRLLSYF